MSETLPFSILRPVSASAVWVPEIDPADVPVGADWGDVDDVVGRLYHAELVALDLETCGTDTWKPETRVVGVGIAWRTGDEYDARYFDIGSMSDEDAGLLFQYVTEWSGEYDGHFVNHNVHFDYALWRMELIRRGLPGELRYTHCTYGLYKQLAGEGFSGQQWGLKPAAVQLLGWPERHDVELDEWIIANGYHTTGPRRAEGETPEQHLANCRAWEATPTRTGGVRARIAADKSQMWRAPPEILGRYCLLDCFAVLQLYDGVLRPALDRFPELEKFHEEYWMPQTRLLAEQQYTGIRIYRPRLEAHAAQLQLDMERHEAEVRACPVLGPVVAAIESARLDAERAEHDAKRPEATHRVRQPRPEPPKYNKDGAVSKRWLYWDQQRTEPAQLQETVRYTKWREKYEELRTKQFPDKKWSPTSDLDMRSLLFESGLVKHGALPTPERGPPKFWIVGVNGRVELEMTDAGQLSVDTATLGQLPEWVGPLAKYKKKHKELTYVRSYLALLHEHAPGEWRLHPGWALAGTKTLRLSGKDPNLQQIPKSLELMECFVPDPGCVWVEGDFTALEPHVLAQLSSDPGLLALYGPDAKPHDRYLFSVASYPGAIGDRVRQYYDVNNPTEDSVARAKKECKKERELGKVGCLQADYGAGWPKFKATCALKGVRLTDDEAKAIHAAQRKLHAAVYEQFGPALEAEWRRRGGWFYSGLGFPVCVWERALKDCINRNVQRTGHDLLVMQTSYLARRLQEEHIPTTGIVWDFHDQLIIQVPEQAAELAKQWVKESVEWLNQEIKSTVRIKMDPRIVRSLGEAKMEEAWQKKYSPPN